MFWLAGVLFKYPIKRLMLILSDNYFILNALHVNLVVYSTIHIKIMSDDRFFLRWRLCRYRLMLAQRHVFSVLVVFRAGDLFCWWVPLVFLLFIYIKWENLLFVCRKELKVLSIVFVLVSNLTEVEEIHLMCRSHGIIFYV